MEGFDVCVRGAGIVGKALALSLARLGLRVALQPEGEPAPGPDLRAYALNAASVSLLKRLNVWDAIAPHAATPVHDMHIEGDAAGAGLDFSAWDQCVAELAWIVDAAALDGELSAALRFAPHVKVLSSPVADAALMAVCEGKSSATRLALGVRVESHPYGQRAIAARLVAQHPHQNTARQWFLSPDVLALLPLDTPEQERSFALVWSLPDERAEAMLKLDGDSFERALSEATGGACGGLKLASERASWPLTLARAEPWSGPGWVLLGDAAHVVHPLAGQGLNLGLADVMALAAVIEQREPWRALGDAKLLRRYARQRATPTWAMSRVTDGLLHLFSSRQPGVRELRNCGLSLVNHLSPVKRWLTARALGS